MRPLRGSDLVVLPAVVVDDGERDEKRPINTRRIHRPEHPVGGRDPARMSGTTQMSVRVEDPKAFSQCWTPRRMMPQTRSAAIRSLRDRASRVYRSTASVT